VEGSDPDREAVQRRPDSSLSCISQSKIDRIGCRIETANGQTLSVLSIRSIIKWMIPWSFTESCYTIIDL